MKFVCVIAMDGAAFSVETGDADGEVARILERVGQATSAGKREGTCRDVNGNFVGQWAIED